MATIFYVIITTIKLSLFYDGSILSDWECRILAYFDYTALTITAYSYVIQGLSRLFFIVFYNHRHLLQYKTHIIMIICQIIFSLLIQLPSLITKDVVFRKLAICFIRAGKFLHIGYVFVFTSIVPLFIIIIIYGIIYHRVNQSSTVIRQSSLHATERDLALMKNILILFLIFFVSAVFGLVFIIIFNVIKSQSIPLYLFAVMEPSIAITIEKICLLFLNSELRRETIKLLRNLHLIRTSNDTAIHPFTITNQTNTKTTEFNISKVDNRIEDKRKTNNKQNLVQDTLPIID